VLVNFEFSAEQEQLRDSVRRYLGARAPIGYVREHYGAGTGGDEVWRGLADLGVAGLLAPAAHGGGGMGMVDAAVVLEECGRGVYPGPYLASAIGAISAVALGGGEREQAYLLPALADGGTVGTFACFEPGQRTDWRSPTTRAQRGAEAELLSGTKAHVLAASHADLFVVSARDGGGRLGLFAVQRGDGVRVEAVPGPDGSLPVANVVLDDARAWRLGARDQDASIAIEATLDRMRVALVVDGVGAAQRALELAVDYAKERVAFDKPIGSFQAVQHLCADMLRAVELARAAGHYACWAVDAGDAGEARRAVAMAAAFAAEELPRVGGAAIQVFGGIGFTWEHDLHLYFKRLLSVGARLGTADDHLAALADLVL
jgi:alkylation response protein AidB-like acyl-CoA dehydrogenase